MLNTVSISLLLTLIYSWEEIKMIPISLIRKHLGLESSLQERTYPLDLAVGKFLAIFTLTLTLIHLLNSLQIGASGLFWQGSLIILIALVALGSGIAIDRLRFLKLYQGSDKFIPIGFAVAGMLSPLAGLFSGAAVRRKDLFRLAFWFALPFLAGAFLMAGGSGSPLTENYNQLILILVGALIVQITLDFLRNYFHTYRFNGISTYYRLALGIVLIAALLG